MGASSRCPTAGGASVWPLGVFNGKVSCQTPPVNHVMANHSSVSLSLSRSVSSSLLLLTDNNTETVWRSWWLRVCVCHHVCVYVWERSVQKYHTHLKDLSLWFLSWAQILKRGCHVNDRDGLTDMTLLHYSCKAGAHGVGENHFITDLWSDSYVLLFNINRIFFFHL